MSRFLILRRELPSDGQAERKAEERDLRPDIAEAGCICKEEEKAERWTPASLELERKDGGKGGRPGRPRKRPQNQALRRCLVHSSWSRSLISFFSAVCCGPGLVGGPGVGQFDRSWVQCWDEAAYGTGRIFLGRGQSERAPPPNMASVMCWTGSVDRA